MTMISSDPFVKDGEDILKHILNIDEGVFQRLMEVSGSKVDYETSMRVLTLITMPRVLDKMPGPLKQDKDVGMKSGVKEYFKIRYAATRGSDDEEISGKVFLSGVQKSCDFEVVRTIKALIKTGRSKHADISDATSVIIREILSRVARSNYLTTKQMCEELEPVGYYEKQLIEAIREVHDFEDEPRTDITEGTVK